MTSPRPPSYVNTPVPIAYADVDDALIVTMTRILGLCWSHDYERTPALTPNQLSDLTGRPRTTLYRHLGILERELGWLRIDRADRRLILRPLVGGMSQDDHPSDLPRQPAPSARNPARGPVNKEIQQALESVGIENPARDTLARDGTLDPVWVHAWHLWTQHPHRSNLTNPAGVIIRKLQNQQPPPDEYLELATLTEEEMSELRTSFWLGGSDLDDKLYGLYPLFFEVYGDPRS